jgi:hypothetical protein
VIFVGFVALLAAAPAEAQMIRVIYAFEPPSEPTSLERMYFRYHTEESVRARGPWLRRYWVFRAIDVPAEADRFNPSRDRLAENWFASLDEYHEALEAHRYLVPGPWTDWPAPLPGSVPTPQRLSLRISGDSAEGELLAPDGAIPLKASRQGADASPAGSWMLKMVFPGNWEYPFRLEIRQDGESYTGVLHTPQGESRLRDGTLADGRLDFASVDPPFARWGPTAVGLAVRAIPTEPVLVNPLPLRGKPYFRWLQAIKYPAGVSHEEAEAWYLEVHAPELKRLEGLLRFMSFAAVDPPSARSPWVRLSEMWFDDYASWREAVLASRPEFTPPPWGGEFPFVDMVSVFVNDVPDVDVLRQQPGQPYSIY